MPTAGLRAHLTLVSHELPIGSVSRQTNPEVSSWGRTGGKVTFSRLLPEVASRIARCLEAASEMSEDAQ